MRKQIIALLTLGAFILFSWNCVKIRATQEVPSAEVVWSKVGGPIMAVQKKSGERIEFSKEAPGYVAGDFIVGNVPATLSIDKSQAKDITQNKNGKITRVITVDDRTFYLKSGRMEGSTISGEGFEKIRIPYSEVDLVWVRKVNPGLTVLANLGLVAIVAVAAVAVAAIVDLSSTPKPAPTTGESCPFVYAFDGEKYVLDAEPYGGSVCEALKRTEWSRLDHLRPVDGQYRLLMTNELEETQYTDELKLVVVDHPKDSDVVPDISGRMHTVSRPLAAFRAYDQNGRDILPLVSKKDDIFWLSRAEEKDPRKTGDLKDTLIFEFPKPAGAKQVKLVANAWTSQWGSLVAKRFLEFYGRDLPDWYDAVNSLGPEFVKTLNWYATEELYLLQIRVETAGGWKTKGMIYGGGPFASKDKAYLLDLSDVPGDTLKIKLTPAATFWMLDCLTVDYTEDLPVHITELAAVKGVAKDGREVAADLASTDRRYLVMPQNGDFVQLSFPAPPPCQGMERSIILKAGGYYTIHVDAAGEPRRDLIQRLQNEPGFSARYALEEYQKAERMVAEKSGRR
jgi:hypothetical protein